MTNQAESQPVERGEVLTGSRMVEEIGEDDLLCFLHLLESCCVDVLDVAVESLARKGNQIAQTTEAIVFDTLTTSEEVNGRISTNTGILAQARRSLTIHLANVELTLHFLGKLHPGWSQMLAMRAPRNEELDEPWVL